MGKDQVTITIILFNLFFILFIVGIIIFIQQYKLKKKEHNAMFQFQKEEHQKELLSTQIEIQSQTMQQIGREIHDNVGQKLTLASLYTQQLALDNKSANSIESIENIGNIINQSLSDLRALSKSLTDDIIEQHSIAFLLEKECKKVTITKACKVHFTSQNSINVNLYTTKAILLRITQEFMQNSLKHAQCKNIYVDIKTTENEVILELKDDGKGFDVLKKVKGIGLSNIKKRTEMLQGTFVMQSSLTLGTQAIIKLPLQ